MQENHFYDTSVLVYAYDNSEREKQGVAKQYLKRIFGGNETGVLSTQVLAEFFNVVTTKFTLPLPAEEAESVIKDFLVSDHWIKLNYTDATLRKAMAISFKYNVQIWDALIAETMKENEVNTIITENEKDFRIIPGIKALNPFRS